MMPRILFKILTFNLLIAANFSNVWSQTVTQNELKTHLRWTFKTAKEQITINKPTNKLVIETLNEDLFQKMVEDLSKFDKKPDYITDVSFDKNDFPTKPASISIDLRDNSIELFSFYKEDEQKYVMDFWINKDVITSQKAALVKKKVTPKKETKQIVINKSPDKQKDIKNENSSKIKKVVKEKDYRDFRYGAAFVWDYSPHIPPLERDINLDIKAPDYLYNVKNRDYESDPKEAHMQLSIKFYRQRNWGLMTKSISLYEKKYGDDVNKSINDFMKATSLIKNIIKEEIVPASKEQIKSVENPKDLNIPSKKSTLFAAINILNNISQRTEVFELKQATLRYVLQYYLDKKDYVKSLQFAKKLYVAASENFVDDVTIYSSRVILHSLAKLHQLDKINDFLENKAVKRLLPAQEGDAYISFIQLENKNTEKLIEYFEKKQKSYSTPIHPSILFNVAEAYFREASYEKAINMFDQFVYHYPGLKVSGHSRLRLALSYDLLDKPTEQTLKLYENAINRSIDPQISYESKMRYVGLRVARNLKLTKKDIETNAFLNKTPIEKKSLTHELKKTLWLVRLRTMIAQEKYEDALAYLTTIPLEVLNLVDKRTFHGDGAEIIVGLIKSLYLKEDYSRAVKVWEVYKDKYETKVAKSPYLNFLVSESFLKNKLYDSYERSFRGLKEIKNVKQRTFPKWVKEHKELNVDNYIKELELIKLVGKKEWEKVESFLELLTEEDKKNLNYNFYKGIVGYHLKKYNNAIESFEQILINPNEQNVLSPGQTAMMLTNYTESLFQIGNQERFRKNAMALIGDLNKSQNKTYSNTRERIHYLLVESLNSDKIINYTELEKNTKNFMENYSKSNYFHRVRYLYGLALINNKKQDEGKDVLNELIRNEKTPSYLKGLARSELSSLIIKNKTI